MSTATVRLAPPAATHDLHAALAEVDRRLGTGVAFNPDLDSQPPPAAIPTGSLALDQALGVGGIPRGRITEVYGPDGAGKTTLVLSVIAQAQQAGGIACFIDTEHALDLAWAATVGVDLERLVLCRPEHGEQALQVADLLIASGSLDVLAVDSIAALVPKVELEGEMGQPAQPGTPQALRPNRPRQHRDAGHQPASPARRHSGHAGLHLRWPGTRLLRLGAARATTARPAQARRPGGRQPYPRPGHQEQGGARLAGRRAGRAHGSRRTGTGQRRGGQRLVDLGRALGEVALLA
jgi:hypothetical protein